MAMHLDHYMIGVGNIYMAAHKLREETGLGFYDGGFFPNGAGMANKIFPLGGGTYIELNGIVDAGMLDTPNGKAMAERTAKGEYFGLLAMRVDTKEEMEEIAKRHNSTVNTGGRTRPDGPPVKWLSTPSGASQKGRVNWYCHEERINMHPSGQPVVPGPGLVTPLGLAWLEVGGTEQEMTDWIGQPASNFPYRFNGKAHGLYALAVKTEKGEVVIRRRSALED